MKLVFAWLLGVPLALFALGSVFSVSASDVFGPGRVVTAAARAADSSDALASRRAVGLSSRDDDVLIETRTLDDDAVADASRSGLFAGETRTLSAQSRSIY